jgi:hypothetical protein
VIQVSGFRFQVSGFRFQVSGFRFQVSGFRGVGVVGVCGGDDWGGSGAIELQHDEEVMGVSPSEAKSGEGGLV